MIRYLSPISLTFSPLGLTVFSRVKLPYSSKIIVNCREFFLYGNLPNRDPIDVFLFVVLYEVSFLSVLEIYSFYKAFLSL